MLDKIIDISISGSQMTLPRSENIYKNITFDGLLTFRK